MDPCNKQDPSWKRTLVSSKPCEMYHRTVRNLVFRLFMESGDWKQEASCRLTLIRPTLTNMSQGYPRKAHPCSPVGKDNIPRIAVRKWYDIISCCASIFCGIMISRVAVANFPNSLFPCSSADKPLTVNPERNFLLTIVAVLTIKNKKSSSKAYAFGIKKKIILLLFFFLYKREIGKQEVGCLISTIVFVHFIPPICLNLMK